MPAAPAGRLRRSLVWAAVGLALALPVAAALASPLLAFRDPIYIGAGLAGCVGLALMLLQPLLAAGYLPGVTLARGRRLHRAIGIALVAAVVLHVGGLWITSPPDVIDALTFASPTPFAVWGVLAMWALFASALAAAVRRRLGLRLWRAIHAALAVVIVVGTAAHALMIDGTMEPLSKAALCLLVVAVTAVALVDLRGWTGGGPGRARRRS